MLPKSTKFISLIVLIVLAIMGCDPITESLIRNETNHNIIVIIQLDKELIDNSYWHPDYDYLLRQAAVSDSIRILSIDKVNLIGVYNLPSLTSCQVDFGIGKKPSFKFNKLTIISLGDTLQFVDRIEIEAAFKNTKSFTYELKIK